MFFASRAKKLHARGRMRPAGRGLLIPGLNVSGLLGNAQVNCKIQFF
jgi:hypothetical protein